jgi:2-oxoglutarate ferredoxin oxidoreductase subunit beta
LFDYLPYIREWNFPHIWCAGCGDGIILKALIRSMDKLGLSRDESVMVSGIGCSSRTPGYIDINTLHTTHGRALAFATGVKVANPDLKVIVVTGDGDATAIGGNHFIHAARRNIDITVLLYNNYIYGMTGGQCSPTTPRGAKASTAQHGNLEPPFNISGLAIAAGASFVARGDAYNVKKLEIPVNMMENLRVSVVSVEKWDKLTAEERKGKFRTGVLRDIEKHEFTSEYANLIERLRAEE